MYTGTAYTLGSECPPLPKGTFRVYGNRFCPYVKRVLLVLQYHKVPHEVININLKAKPEWFVDKSPTGTVPLVEVDEGLVSESLICARYIDCKYGAGKLAGKDAFQEAQQSMRLVILEQMNKTFYELLGKSKSLEEARKAAEKPLKAIEAVSSGGYFGGDEANFFDLMAYPFFQRLVISKDLVGGDFFETSKYPKLAAWMGLMAQQEFVHKCFESTGILSAFYKQYLDPAIPIPDYNIGL